MQYFFMPALVNLRNPCISFPYFPFTDLLVDEVDGYGHNAPPVSEADCSADRIASYKSYRAELDRKLQERERLFLYDK